MRKITIFIFFWMCATISFGQTIFVSSGLIRSNTLWRMTAEKTNTESIGLRYFEESKVDYVFTLGFEYLEHENWSISSSLSYYQSGGKLAVNERPESNIYFSWDLENNRYDIPYIGLSTNVNLTIYKQDRAGLEGIIGLHGDYVIATETTGVVGDIRDPLGYMYRQGGLNRWNGGVSLGAQYTIEFEKCILGLQYIFAPKIWNLGYYNNLEADEPPRNGVTAFTVREKAAFTQLTFGYKLNKDKL